ncbi:MAG: hypothetical protein M3O74_06835 [Pseudomonadota bacterium]|nr:hypothetical protein [Pseudomonadota bacterium]
MANNTAAIAPISESSDIDVSAKEVALKLDSVSAEIACISQAFADLGALFESIIASSIPGSLTRRLAEFGRNVSEDKESSYGIYSEQINDMASGYLAILDQKVDA